MKTITGTDVSAAAQLLRAGALVAIPTETVYGLAANALDPDAVLNVFAAKGRPAFNPLIVHVHSAPEFFRYAQDVPEVVLQLAERFSPGPLTFVLPKKSIVPDIVTGGGDTVALRVPGHPLTLQLLKQLDFPLAAPSANPSGYISPVSALHVMEQLEGKVAYILDGGPSMIGIESTVVMVEEGRLVVLRLGGVPVAELEEVAGKAELRINQSSDPRSPGQLRSHYAPRIPLELGVLDELLERHRGKKVAVLALEKRRNGETIVAQELLSPSGDLREAARNLFAALRRLDQSGAELILAERVPYIGLGAAINDRLERAAAEK